MTYHHAHLVSLVNPIENHGDTKALQLAVFFVDLISLNLVNESVQIKLYLLSQVLFRRRKAN
jgi:hypothetical protein